MKIKKGDRVVVLTGKDVGKTGDVMRVIPERNRVIVDGVNVVKRHQKSTSPTQPGGIIEKDMPIHASNVAVMCSKCGPTRVGYRFDGGEKVRVCRKCGKAL